MALTGCVEEGEGAIAVITMQLVGVPRMGRRPGDRAAIPDEQIQVAVVIKITPCCAVCDPVVRCDAGAGDLREDGIPIIPEELVPVTFHIPPRVVCASSMRSDEQIKVAVVVIVAWTGTKQFKVSNRSGSAERPIVGSEKPQYKLTPNDGFNDAARANASLIRPCACTRERCWVQKTTNAVSMCTCEFARAVASTHHRPGSGRAVGLQSCPTSHHYRSLRKQTRSHRPPRSTTASQK